MSNISLEDMIFNSNKWQNICALMGNKKDADIVVNIIEILKDNEKTAKESTRLKTKDELNVICDILYNPQELNYISAVKSRLISDIDYFINEEKRNTALKSSNLIGK